MDANRELLDLLQTVHYVGKKKPDPHSPIAEFDPDDEGPINPEHRGKSIDAPSPYPEGPPRKKPRPKPSPTLPPKKEVQKQGDTPPPTQKPAPQPAPAPEPAVEAKPAPSKPAPETSPTPEHKPTPGKPIEHPEVAESPFKPKSPEASSPPREVEGTTHLRKLAKEHKVPEDVVGVYLQQVGNLTDKYHHIPDPDKRRTHMGIDFRTWLKTKEGKRAVRGAGGKEKTGQVRGMPNKIVDWISDTIESTEPGSAKKEMSNTILFKRVWNLAHQMKIDPRELIRRYVNNMEDEYGSKWTRKFKSRQELFADFSKWAYSDEENPQHEVGKDRNPQRDEDKTKQRQVAIDRVRRRLLQVLEPNEIRAASRILEDDERMESFWHHMDLEYRGIDPAKVDDIDLAEMFAEFQDDLDAEDNQPIEGYDDPLSSALNDTLSPAKKKGEKDQWSQLDPDPKPEKAPEPDILQHLDQLQAIQDKLDQLDDQDPKWQKLRDRYDKLHQKMERKYGHRALWWSQVKIAKDSKEFQQELAEFAEADQLVEEIKRVQQEVTNSPELAETLRRFNEVSAKKNALADQIEDEELTPEQQEQWDDLSGELDTLQDMKIEIRDALIPKIHQALFKDVKYPVEYKRRAQPIGLDKTQRVEFNRGVDFIDRVVSYSNSLGTNAFTIVKPIHPQEVQRSVYDKGVINLAAHADSKTVVHEYGHHIEVSDPDILAACVRFLNHRVRGEAPQSMAKLFPHLTYGEDEMGREDDFGKIFGKGAPSAFYVGKVYGDSNDPKHTEILSMGLELMYSDPAGFAERDPEYFKFVLAICHGKFRKGGEQKPDPRLGHRERAQSSPNEVKGTNYLRNLALQMKIPEDAVGEYIRQTGSPADKKEVELGVGFRQWLNTKEGRRAVRGAGGKQKEVRGVRGTPGGVEEWLGDYAYDLANKPGAGVVSYRIQGFNDGTVGMGKGAARRYIEKMEDEHGSKWTRKFKTRQEIRVDFEKWLRSGDPNKPEHEANRDKSARAEWEKADRLRTTKDWVTRRVIERLPTDLIPTDQEVADWHLHKEDVRQSDWMQYRDWHLDVEGRQMEKWLRNHRHTAKARQETSRTMVEAMAERVPDLTEEEAYKFVLSTMEGEAGTWKHPEIQEYEKVTQALQRKGPEYLDRVAGWITKWREERGGGDSKTSGVQSAPRETQGVNYLRELAKKRGIPEDAAGEFLKSIGNVSDKYHYVTDPSRINSHLGIDFNRWLQTKEGKRAVRGAGGKEKTGKVRGSPKNVEDWITHNLGEVKGKGKPYQQYQLFKKVNGLAVEEFDGSSRSVVKRYVQNMEDEYGSKWTHKFKNRRELLKDFEHWVGTHHKEGNEGVPTRLKHPVGMRENPQHSEEMRRRVEGSRAKIGRYLASVFLKASPEEIEEFQADEETKWGRASEKPWLIFDTGEEHEQLLANIADDFETWRYLKKKAGQGSPYRSASTPLPNRKAPITKPGQPIDQPQVAESPFKQATSGAQSAPREVEGTNHLREVAKKMQIPEDVVGEYLQQVGNLTDKYEYVTDPSKRQTHMGIDFRTWLKTKEGKRAVYKARGGEGAPRKFGVRMTPEKATHYIRTRVFNYLAKGQDREVQKLANETGLSRQQVAERYVQNMENEHGSQWTRKFNTPRRMVLDFMKWVRSGKEGQPEHEASKEESQLHKEEEARRNKAGQDGAIRKIANKFAPDQPTLDHFEKWARGRYGHRWFHDPIPLFEDYLNRVNNPHRTL